jgi:hypothetical protein
MLLCVCVKSGKLEELICEEDCWRSQVLVDQKWGFWNLKMSERADGGVYHVSHYNQIGMRGSLASSYMRWSGSAIA